MSDSKTTGKGKNENEKKNAVKKAAAQKPKQSLQHPAKVKGSKIANKNDHVPAEALTAAPLDIPLWLKTIVFGLGGILVFGTLAIIIYVAVEYMAIQKRAGENDAAFEEGALATEEIVTTSSVSESQEKIVLVPSPFAGAAPDIAADLIKGLTLPGRAIDHIALDGGLILIQSYDGKQPYITLYDWQKKTKLFDLPLQLK